MTAKAAAETKNQTPDPTPPSEQVLILSVKDLSVDFAWNARSGAWWEDAEIVPATPPKEGDEAKKPRPKKEKVSDRGDFAQFKASILETGTNQEPILARQPAKAGGKPRVVAGFRRYKAVLDLAEQANYGGPTLAEQGFVRVIVREMTDQQARIANAVENVARDDLSGPDLCWTVGQLAQQYNLSDSAVAARLGKSQPYISKLHRIHDALSPKVLQMWRNSAVRVTIDDIEKEVIMISKDSDSRPSAAEQEDYFQRVVEGKGGKQATSRGPDAWIETKQKEAHDVGWLLGLLQTAGVIEVRESDPEAWIFESVVELPKRFKELNPSKQKKVTRSILAAFSSGVEAGMAEASGEDEEEEADEEAEDGDED